MKSIEEYYYQSGMESLELSKQEAKDNPVKSSFASFGDKFIGNSMKNNSNHSDQRVYREELLYFILLFESAKG